jgi:hypothetical protein
MVCLSLSTSRPHKTPTQPAHPRSTPPRLWPALPAETQRQLAQELARLLRLIGTPASAGLETRHADRDTCR